MESDLHVGIERSRADRREAELAVAAPPVRPVVQPRRAARPLTRRAGGALMTRVGTVHGPIAPES
jgi:hypothetical protein